MALRTTATVSPMRFRVHELYVVAGRVDAGQVVGEDEHD